MGNNLLDGPTLLSNASWTRPKAKPRPFHCNRCDGPQILTVNGVPHPIYTVRKVRK